MDNIYQIQTKILLCSFYKIFRTKHGLIFSGGDRYEVSIPDTDLLVAISRTT